MPNLNRGLMTGDCGQGSGGLTRAESDAAGGRDERCPAPGLLQTGLRSCVRCRGWLELLRVNLQITHSGYLQRLKT